MKCCFCFKPLPDNWTVYEIRGGLGNKTLAYLCKDCYEKLYKIKHGISVLKDNNKE